MSTTKTQVRWSALTPGMPMRLHRLRFMTADAGAAVAAQAAAPAAPAATAAVPAPSPAPAAAPVIPAAAPAAVPPATSATFTAEYVAELRSEAAEHRVKARDTATANETLATENATLKAQLAELQTATILDAAITKAGGATITKAALKGDNILAGLDPAADDYATKVDEAVAKYVTDHPELKAAPVATRSSIPTAGGTGERSTTSKSLTDAVASAYGTA